MKTRYEMRCDYRRVCWPPLSSCTDGGVDETTRLRRLNELRRDAAIYVCAVGQAEKFQRRLLADCFEKAANKAAFDEVEQLTAAFRAVERMALNLLYQPWRRRDFAIVKQWSSFAACLSSLLGSETAAALLALLGYERRGRVYLLNACPPASELLALALDCFLAQVECQILDTIMTQHKAQLETTQRPADWRDVVASRRRSVGDVSAAVNALRPSPLVDVDSPAAAEPPIPPPRRHGPPAKLLFAESDHSLFRRNEDATPTERPQQQQERSKPSQLKERVVSGLLRLKLSEVGGAATRRNKTNNEAQEAVWRRAECPNCMMYIGDGLLICPYCDAMIKPRIAGKTAD